MSADPKLPDTSPETYAATVAEINAEVAHGHALSEQLVAHVRRMGAGGCSGVVVAGDVKYHVTVRAEETPVDPSI